MADPALDLANFYVTALAITAGEDVLVGAVRPATAGVNSQCIFVRTTGGTKQITMGADNSNDEHAPTVQVLVRGPREEPDTARAFCKTVMDATHKATVVIGAGPATYSVVLVAEPEPNDIGPDENQQHRFTFNVEFSNTGAQ